MKELELGSAKYHVIHLAHPGIVMRAPSERNPWPRLHKGVHIPEAKKNLSEIIEFAYPIELKQVLQDYTYIQKKEIVISN